jgi:hypothetical protein
VLGYKQAQLVELSVLVWLCRWQVSIVDAVLKGQLNLVNVARPTVRTADLQPICDVFKVRCLPRPTTPTLL